MPALVPENIKFIVNHCSATNPLQDIGFAEIDRMHKARTYRAKSGEIKHWSGCGYHVIIRRNGVIEMGRSLQTMGAHAAGHNHHSWGVCWVGGVNENGDAEDNFTPEQMLSGELINRGLLIRAPHAEILGHRDLSPDLDGDGIIESHEWLKMCPCFDVREWWREVVSR